MKRSALLLSFAALSLVGCGEPHSDLRQFVADAEKMPRGPIPPIPEVKPYEAFAYDAYDLQDPFTPRKMVPARTASIGGNLQPDLTRRREPLEAYPLENVSMVGTLQQNRATYALLKAPDNNLFRVRVGNYLGQNFGRITEITESAIKLKELVQDSSGDWTERTATLTLVDEPAKN